MKQAIEIDVPEGYKVVCDNNKIELVKIHLELPKTWDEFCEHHKVSLEECYINGNSEIIQNVNTRTSYQQRNILPSKGAAEQHLALMQLHQLRDCYRQGWIPEWKNDYQEKYVVESEEASPVGCSYNIPYFLAFQSREIAEKFKANFIDLIKQAGDLIYI